MNEFEKQLPPSFDDFEAAFTELNKDKADALKGDVRSRSPVKNLDVDVDFDPDNVFE